MFVSYLISFNKFENHSIKCIPHQLLGLGPKLTHLANHLARTAAQHHSFTYSLKWQYQPFVCYITIHFTPKR